MNNFWNLSDNSAIAEGGNFEISGGNIEPIPDDTTCLAAIEEAGWNIYQGEEYINVKWRIAAPQTYSNRVVFQKIKVNDGDAKKTDRAKRMLAAIDANAGGKLRASGAYPDDGALTRCLAGKMMQIKVMVWESDDGSKRGNWIRAVAAKGAPATPASSQAAIQDGDIPF